MARMNRSYHYLIGSYKFRPGVYMVDIGAGRILDYYVIDYPEKVFHVIVNLLRSKRCILAVNNLSRRCSPVSVRHIIATGMSYIHSVKRKIVVVGENYWYVVIIGSWSVIGKIYYSHLVVSVKYEERGVVSCPI